MHSRHRAVAHAVWRALTVSVTDWDGRDYGQVSGLQRAMVQEAMAGLVLAKQERVLDVGCGDGFLTFAVAGMVLSAAAFLQMSTWPANALTLHIGPLLQADVALAACGLGFGLVIAPLTAAVLAMTRDQSHGLATSLVVLARTMGMLVGLSALTAFGLYRFHQILGTPVVTDPDLRARVDHLARLVSAAFLQEYREIFTVAAAICAVSAVVMLVCLGQRLRATAIR